MSKKKPNYSNEELLDILRRVSYEKGYVRCEDFKVYNGLPHYYLYVEHFGSWNNAKTLAGLPINKQTTYKTNKENIIKEFKAIVNNLGYVPSLNELSKCDKISSHYIIYNYFENYDELISECGFEKNTTSQGAYKEDFLINEIKRFVKEFGYVPKPTDFDKLEGYPSRKTFTNHFEKFNDVVILAGFEPSYKSIKERRFINKEKYTKEFLINELFRFKEEYGHIPTISELEANDNYPNRQHYRTVFGNYNNALKEADLPLNAVSQYEDEFLHSEFERFIKENGKIPTFRDFNNSDYPSFWCYQQRFGSWRDAIRHYGYDAIYDNCNFDYIKENLLKLANNISVVENRKILSVEDINKCEYLPNYCCCMKHMKENNYTIRQILVENGFDFCKGSTGMVYNFDDGEITKSSYEFKFSNFLRSKNINYKKDYFRDVKYKTFIPNYYNNMDCDYLLKINGKEIYIEIAGYLRDYEHYYYDNKIISTSHRTEDYRQKLMKKEQMLKDNNLEYYILFPSDIREDFLLELFNKL